MNKVYIRFYEELNDFLDPGSRKQWIERELTKGMTVKALVEEMGIPHTEVDLVLVNGESKDFSCQPGDQDRISVYPVFESFNIKGISLVRPEPLRELRFILDVHLGKLAKSLRLLGFDALYSNRYDDEEIARISRSEKRIILTRDRGLLKRKIATHGYCLRSRDPDLQLGEVIRRFDLEEQLKPFSRCLDCNMGLEPISRELAAPLVPALVFDNYEEYTKCPSCGKIYWKGSHWESMMEKLRKIEIKKP
jgi:uncharacterized protein with PIN domain